MTGTRVMMLASALLVAVPAVAVEARNPVSEQRVEQRPGARDDAYRRGTPRFDLASNNGFEDGYDEGRRDGLRGDRPDPIREKRYRSGDHGYERRYGSRDLYKDRYRSAFVRGYQEGYADGRREDRRNDRWDDRRDDRRRDSRAPWWWPFGR